MGEKAMRDKHIPTITARSFDELPNTLVAVEAAALCCLSYAGIRYHLETGALRARKASSTWLIEKKDLLHFAKKRGIVLVFCQIERAF